MPLQLEDPVRQPCDGILDPSTGEQPILSYSLLRLDDVDPPPRPSLTQRLRRRSAVIAVVAVVALALVAAVVSGVVTSSDDQIDPSLAPEPPTPTTIGSAAETLDATSDGPASSSPAGDQAAEDQADEPSTQASTTTSQTTTSQPDTSQTATSQQVTSQPTTSEPSRGSTATTSPAANAPVGFIQGAEGSPTTAATSSPGATAATSATSPGTSPATTTEDTTANSVTTTTGSTAPGTTSATPGTTVASTTATAPASTSGTSTAPTEATSPPPTAGPPTATTADTAGPGPTTATTAATTTTTTPAPATTAPATTSGGSGSGELIWSDDFNRLDTSRWAVEHSTYGDGNNELQCYRPENVSVSGGRLVLRAVTETYTCPNGSTRQVTSGMVRSKGLRLEPGQAIEFRVKLTPGNEADQGGLWPAVWTSGWAGGGWPRAGEIDFLEVMTANNPKRSMFSIHYAEPDGSHGVSNKPVVGDENFSAGWHTVRFDYGNNGRLVWYLDGRQVHVIDAADTIQGYPAPFDQPTGEIKINLALGGRPGPLSSGAVGNNGATFEIDYLRVYRL